MCVQVVFLVADVGFTLGKGLYISASDIIFSFMTHPYSNNHPAVSVSLQVYYYPRSRLDLAS